MYTVPGVHASPFPRRTNDAFRHACSLIPLSIAVSRIARTAVLGGLESVPREGEANARHPDAGAQPRDRGVFGVNVGDPLHRVREVHGHNPARTEGEWHNGDTGVVRLGFAQMRNSKFRSRLMLSGD